MLKTSPTVAMDEMIGIEKMIQHWIVRLKEGIPVLTFTARDEDLEMYMTQWVGDLRILAGKADNLADILSGVR